MPDERWSLHFVHLLPVLTPLACPAISNSFLATSPLEVTDGPCNATALAARDAAFDARAACDFTAARWQPSWEGDGARAATCAHAEVRRAQRDVRSTRRGGGTMRPQRPVALRLLLLAAAPAVAVLRAPAVLRLLWRLVLVVRLEEPQAVAASTATGMRVSSAA